MVRFVRRLTKSRGAWLALAASALLFELCALFFQYGLGLQPCVLCIYERVTLFGIFFAGLLGAIAPKTPWLRYPALLLWGYSAFRGLQIALKHVDIQLNPSPFNVCSPFAEFPTWLPLDRWLPQLFMPTGDCSVISWRFLDMTMPQWLVVLFGGYLLVFVIILVGNLLKSRCCENDFIQ